MKVYLSKKDYEAILERSRELAPVEACGLIAGHDDESGRHIDKVYLLTNVDNSNEHFTIDDKEHLKAVLDMRKNGLKPIGNWHSHPESPSRQSEEDKRLSYDRNASYLIISLCDKEPVINSFHFDGTDSVKEELIIK